MFEWKIRQMSQEAIEYKELSRIGKSLGND